jgi:hypothetical protein
MKRMSATLSMFDRMLCALGSGFLIGSIIPAQTPFWVAACISALVYIALVGTLRVLLHDK